MTRKHYELIARVLLTYSAGQNRLQYVALCRAMALELAIENTRFNTQTFLKACGIDA